MLRQTLALLAALGSLFAGPAFAEQLTEPSSELKFEKNPTVEGRRFVCLGTGIRKKVVFKVYAMVFCVDQAAAQAELAKYFEGPGKAHAALQGAQLAAALQEDAAFFRYLIAMPVEKAAEMVFLRNVEATKMKETFTESLTRALGTGEQQRVASFVSLLGTDVKDGDRMSLRTRPSGDIAVGIGSDVKKLSDEKLARAVWEAYFGPSGVSPTLKESVAAGVAALRK